MLSALSLVEIRFGLAEALRDSAFAKPNILNIGKKEDRHGNCDITSSSSEKHLASIVKGCVLEGLLIFFR